MQMYIGRHVIQIFIAENILVQILLRHARSIFEKKVTNQPWHHRIKQVVLRHARSIFEKINKKIAIHD